MLLLGPGNGRIRRSLLPRRTSHSLTWIRTTVPGVLAGAAAYVCLGAGRHELGPALVVCLVVSWTHMSVSRHMMAHVRFLPLMRLIVPIAAPVLAFLILGVLEIAGLLPLSLIQVAMVCGLGALGSALVAVLLSEPKRPHLRVGVVGLAATAADLRAELAAQMNSTVVVVGHIAIDDVAAPRLSGEAEAAPIGALGELANTVVEQRLDLLLVSSTVPRMSFFNEMEATCSHLEVRVLELSNFYEHAFGHVPLRAINAAWFQWVMHPRYSPRIPPAKRIFDLCIASCLALVVLPIVGILALLIKLEGGPAFYRQIRIGEGGKPFQVLKLRSMRVTHESMPAQWCAADDDRVTALGGFMRRVHLDELPQLVNVLKGDMSIVGPRPEQPSFVASLEESVPFYSRRHVVRPGITGWAQVRCGYAGSHEGTLWKLSHDLYYLKHRSRAFDLLILGETLRMFFSGSQFPTELNLPSFVHGGADSRPLARAPQVAATRPVGK
jgi:exopolysaccharide biosynthesis polyprenyl glycosylphosphotransferase